MTFRLHPLLLSAALLAGSLSLAAGADGPSTPADTSRKATPAQADSARKPSPADTSSRVARKPAAQMIAEADSAVKARGGARADSAELFLSWNAPWGSKRASRERRPACADSSQGDTLYLCMRPWRSSERFLAFTAELVVHSTGSDTLGPWWHMKGKGGANPGAMSVEWAALQDWAPKQPFPMQGQGLVQLETHRSTARVKLLYGVPILDMSYPLEPAATYVLARIVFKHFPQRQLAGCSTPVVIEWESSTLTFDLRDEPRVARGERFVSFAGPYSLSAPFRSSQAGKAWKPPTKAPPKAAAPKPTPK